MRHGLVLASLAARLAGCSPSQELGLSYIPPALVAELDLTSTARQAHPFEFDRPGTYELRYMLRPRHGPGSSPTPQRLEGHLTIHDSTRNEPLTLDFVEELAPNQVGGVLASFHSSTVAGDEPHTLAVTLAPPSPGLAEHYEGLRISLKRRPRFPLMY